MEEERGENHPIEATSVTKRKVTLKLIEHKASRKACYKKRQAGFLKKMQEITTLCNIDACAIIFGPGDTSPMVWPSPTVAKHLLQRFQNTPEMERFKKTVNHRAYMQEKTKRIQRQLVKLKESNNKKEMSIFMHQIYHDGKSLSDFEDNDLRRLLNYVEEKLKVVRQRISHFEQSLSPNPPPPSISCPQDNRVQNDIDSWFDIDEQVSEPQSALDLVKDANQINGGIGFNYESDSVMLPLGNFGGLIGESDSTVLSHGNFGGLNGETDLGVSPQVNFRDLGVEVDHSMLSSQGNFSALNVESDLLGLHQGNFGGNNGEENLGLLHGNSTSEIGAGSSIWLPYGHFGSTFGGNYIRNIGQHNENYGGHINNAGLWCNPSNFGANNGEAAMGELNANFAGSNNGRNLNTDLLTNEKFANSSEGVDFEIPTSFEENFPRSDRGTARI